MGVFLEAINQVFDLLFRPFRSLHPLYALVVFSALTGILLVLVFRYTSNQKEIRRVKDRIQAHVLEVRLFQDQLRVVLAAYPRILFWTAAYLRHSLKPLAIMVVPLVLLFVQLELRLGCLPLHPQETFLVKAKLATPDSLDQVSLRLPDGLRLTAPPLRIPAEKEIDWRVQAEKHGQFAVDVVLAGDAFSKHVSVADQIHRLSTTRVRASLLGQLLYPGEPPLPAAGPLDSIEVGYPRRSVNFGFFQSAWLIPFIVLSLVAGYAVKGLLRTEI